jgi:hypothetical protein
MSQRHKLAFDVLSDPGNRVAGEFGLTFKLPEDLHQVYGKFGIDLKKYNGDESSTADAGEVSDRFERYGSCRRR